MNQYKERVAQLKAYMRQEHVDYYIVPTDDYHQSEYVGDYFKCRAYLTGFTGSAGTALVTGQNAYLWTDGRYFIQAEQQLSGSGIILMKQGEPGVLRLSEFLAHHLKKGQTIAFDGRCISKKDAETYLELADSHGAYVRGNLDLIDLLWKDRPKRAKEPVWVLDTAYAGRSAAEKIADVRAWMRKEDATVQILSALDDICWMLNIRGNDVEYFPLALGYCMVTEKRVIYYTDGEKLDEKVRAHLKECGVTLAPYERIYEDVKHLSEDETVLYDPVNMNFALYQCLPDVYCLEHENPQILLKAVKNETEIANIRIAEHKDSIAHVRFMKWLKDACVRAGSKKGAVLLDEAGQVITEIDAHQRLDAFRMEMGNFLQPSFDPISAYGSHGAIIHYAATPESNIPLKTGGMLLTDTGAGFLEGSTDITRNYCLGEISDEEKEHFTLVAMSNLRLAAAKFLQGASGGALDAIARQPLWERGLDFKHGTGHGVGYLLNIHEGPQAFRYRGADAALEVGMVITDEPGLYIEGSHGIRLENELLVRAGQKTEFGQFLYFEILTMIPFDLDAIKQEVLTEEDRKLLNQYHRAVYEALAGDLSAEEAEWLKQYTREI